MRRWTENVPAWPLRADEGSLHAAKAHASSADPLVRDVVGLDWAEPISFEHERAIHVKENSSVALDSWPHCFPELRHRCDQGKASTTPFRTMGSPARRDVAPKTERAWIPRSPKTSTSKSEHPFKT